VSSTEDFTLNIGTYDLASAANGLALLDQTVRTEKHNTDLASFQVHAHALDTRGEPITQLATYFRGIKTRMI
jgi:hypothetical protein